MIASGNRIRAGEGPIGKGMGELPLLRVDARVGGGRVGFETVYSIEDEVQAPVRVRVRVAHNGKR